MIVAKMAFILYTKNRLDLEYIKPVFIDTGK